MEIELVRRDLVARLDPHLVLPLLGEGLQPLRLPDVPLRERRVLQELPVLVPVALRRLDRRGRLDDQVALRPGLRVEHVRRPTRDYDVIPGPVVQLPEDRLDPPRSLVDEIEVVALPIAIEVRHLLVRHRDRHRDVRVVEQDDPPTHRIPALLQILRLEMMVPQHLLVRVLHARVVDPFDLARLRRHVVVIDQRRAPRESPRAHELLGVELPIRAAELRVALVGRISKGVIHRHGVYPILLVRVPRRSISSADRKCRPCRSRSHHRGKDTRPARPSQSSART